MEIIIIGIIILIVASIITAIVEYWWLFLLVIVASAVFSIIFLFKKEEKARTVVKAVILYEEPIIRRDTVNTGYSSGISWTSRNVYHTDHYEHRDVLVGYKVHFAVTYKDGGCGEMTCEKGDSVYNILINKTHQERRNKP